MYEHTGNLIPSLYVLSSTFQVEMTWEANLISQYPSIGWENSALKILFIIFLKLFEDVFLRNVTAITVDWIARHLFVAMKTSWNETQVFFIDLELKTKSLKALNIQLGKRNSTISSLLSYPFLR